MQLAISTTTLVGADWLFFFYFFTLNPIRSQFQAQA